MKLYFIDKVRADIQLVDGRLVVTGEDAEEADSIATVLRGYRKTYGSDAEIYKRLPRIFNGYWHVDETS